MPVITEALLNNDLVDALKSALAIANRDVLRMATALDKVNKELALANRGTERMATALTEAEAELSALRAEPRWLPDMDGRTMSWAKAAYALRRAR